LAPTLLRSGPYRFFFYAGEEAVEPPHVHVTRDNLRAKYWLDPVRVADDGSFSPVELRRIRRVVEEHREQFLERWNDGIQK